MICISLKIYRLGVIFLPLILWFYLHSLLGKNLRWCVTVGRHLCEQLKPPPRRWWVDWKWRTWKWRTIKIAGHEIAGHEKDGPSSRAWKCRTWKWRTKYSMAWNWRTLNCKTWNCRTWKCRTWNCKTWNWRTNNGKVVTETTLECSFCSYFLNTQQ